MTYKLAFYEKDLAYGGPEEGGWYYETGRLVRVFKEVDNEEHAYALARRANRLMHHIQSRKRPVSSVAYAGGVYGIAVYDREPPQYTPEHRPYYS